MMVNDNATYVLLMSIVRWGDERSTNITLITSKLSKAKKAATIIDDTGPIDWNTVPTGDMWWCETRDNGIFSWAWEIRSFRIDAPDEHLLLDYSSLRQLFEGD